MYRGSLIPNMPKSGCITPQSVRVETDKLTARLSIGQTYARFNCLQLRSLVQELGRALEDIETFR